MTKKRGRGRPGKLDETVEAKLLEALRDGNFRSTACAYAGIGFTTFRDWFNRGAKQQTGKWANFRRAILAAEKQAEMNAVKLVMKAAKNDAKHAEWWLSHRFPERWADKSRQRVSVSGVEDGPPIQVSDARERLMARLGAAASSGPAPGSDMGPVRG